MTPTQIMPLLRKISLKITTHLPGLILFKIFVPENPPICLSFRLNHAVTCGVHAKNTNVKLFGFIRLESGYFEMATANVNLGARNVLFFFEIWIATCTFRLLVILAQKRSWMRKIHTLCCFCCPHCWVVINFISFNCWAPVFWGWRSMGNGPWYEGVQDGHSKGWTEETVY